MTLPLGNGTEREIGCSQCWFSQKATGLTTQNNHLAGGSVTLPYRGCVYTPSFTIALHLRSRGPKDVRLPSKVRNAFAAGLAR